MSLKLLLTALIFCLSATNAYAMFCSNCATNTQMAASNQNQVKGYAETLKQTLNQIESLQNQMESISYQIQNLQNLEVHSWGNARAQLDQLANVARQGNAMAYSLVDLNEQWSTKFQGNSAWAEEVQKTEEVTQQYREWGDMMQDTAKSALMVANEMAAVQAEDDLTIESIQQHSSSATGALQVAQAGNEIAAQSTRQLQKMQTLLQADIQMTATSLALAEEQEAQRRAASDALITSPDELKTNINDGHDWTHLW